MSGKPYSEEFKIEAVKQITDRGYKIDEVPKRLGVTANRAMKSTGSKAAWVVPSVGRLQGVNHLAG
jgi:transposase